MAKKKKNKSESQLSLEAEYRRVRKNLLKNVRSLSRRGYDVLDIKIPSIPQKITEGSIAKIESLNEKRYSKVSHYVFDYKREKSGKLVFEEKRVKGDIYKKEEKKLASNKKYAEEKSREYELKYREAKQQREYEMSKLLLEGKQDEYNKLREKDLYINYAHDNPQFADFVKRLEKSGSKYSTDDMIRVYEYSSNKQPIKEEMVIDPRTGEVFPKSEISNRSDSGIYPILEPSETAAEIIKNALDDLEIMIQYEGNGRDSYSKEISTRNNAEKIRDFIEHMAQIDPEGIADILRQMSEQDGFHTVDFMYSSGGYQHFIAYYNAAFGTHYVPDEDWLCPRFASLSIT